MIKKLFSLIIWVLIAIRMTGSVFAQQTPAPAVSEAGFSASYDVIYDITEDGSTLVTEKISLKNLTSQYYASQFKMTIGATEISDVRAFDEVGPMAVTQTTQDSSTIIEVKFNQQVAGVGKTLNWTLSFKSRDFAEKIGKVWEIRAPKIAAGQNLSSYNLTISVPQHFGEPTLITPIPKRQSIAAGRMFLTFAKEQLMNSGVSASFGSNQLFDFDLSYHLQNKNLVPILTNISLPPDTAYQDVIYQRLDPKPVNVTLDDDGNYLAWYRLKRGEKLDIKLIGSAKLYTNSKVKNPTLSSALRKKYTQSDKYWEKENPVIIEKLNEVLGSSPPQDTTEKARLIYLFVVNSLKYDSSRLKGDIERFGAVTALNNPSQAVCMEFTDLFISLARAAGIPARELDGYAYTANLKLRPLSLNQDILHAWPEYFDDKKGWVMVDPTWENTTGGVDYFSKLDLNHFVFAIKGSSSSRPAPAGSFKFPGSDSRDVKVELSDVDFLGKPQIDVKIDVKDSIIAGFPGKVKVTISNLGNAIFPPANMSVSAGTLSIRGGETSSSGPIPAFGVGNFEYNLSTIHQPFELKTLLDDYNDEIVVAVGGQKFTKAVKVQPFLLFQTVPLIGILILGSAVGIYLIILGAFFYRKRFAKHHHKS